ncbi:MAG: hypothetical protein APF80_04720 [Alphaproteobacteria bacterium BRH_c36]|nr:MAG: hypothetical protein APF80_04720 [Alphaproteobacteria bacterium BRH_c36]
MCATATYRANLTTRRAIILAGGKGRRLRPFTASFPKPLVPLGDKPILEIILRQLANQGLKRVSLAVGHLSDLIRAYVAQNEFSRRHLEIDFYEEVTPTGTAGPLASIEGLTDSFLVMNGDVLTNLDYRNLFAAHETSGAVLTIASHNKQERIDLGVLEADENGRLLDYVEKPIHEFEVSMGVYVYSPRALSYIEPGVYLDLPDLVKALLTAGEKVQIHRNDAFWLDIGRPDDYAKAQDIIESDPELFGHLDPQLHPPN